MRIFIFYEVKLDDKIQGHAVVLFMRSFNL